MAPATLAGTATADRPLVCVQGEAGLDPTSQQPTLRTGPREEPDRGGSLRGAGRVALGPREDDRGPKPEGRREHQAPADPGGDRPCLSRPGAGPRQLALRASLPIPGGGLPSACRDGRSARTDPHASWRLAEAATALGSRATPRSLGKRRRSAPRAVRTSARDRLRPDSVWSHHLVVLVLQDVAVPHVQAREIEQRLDPRDLVRVSDDRVLVARLPTLGGSRATFERLAVHHLELHLVDVGGVGVLGEVVDFPDLGGPERRV